MEEIVTGEAVVLDLPCARFPSRLLARVLDVLVEAFVLFVFFIVIGVIGNDGVLDSAAVGAIALAAMVLVIVGYPVAFETLSRGRSLGKMAMGLRVVADDGSPVRFRHALVRALAGFVECWLLLGVPALITAMLSARGKRLGDIFAGTFAVRVRTPRPGIPLAVGPGPGPYPMALIHPSLRPWAASLDLSVLPEQLAASAASFLSRYTQLTEEARVQLGSRLAADVAARISPPPPPGMYAPDFLHTVLAERRNRELSRLMPPAPSQAPQWPAPQWAAPAQDTVPAQDTLPPQDIVPPQDTAFTPPS